MMIALPAVAFQREKVLRALEASALLDMPSNGIFVLIDISCR